MGNELQYVVVSGNAFDGLTIWGPFENCDQALEWADCNGQTDLKDVPWNLVPLEPPNDEDEERDGVFHTADFG